MSASSSGERSMNTVIYIAAGVIAVAIVAVIVLKKGKDAPKPAPAEDSGDPELYALGMNPISDKPVMYALTTCQHCKNTLRFLNEKGVEPVVIYLDEFKDEIDEWVIDTLKEAGCATAKQVLAIPREELLERTDLEEETIDNVIETLKTEFEE